MLARRDAVILISYESTCADGRNALAEICAQLEIAEEGMLDTAAMFFKSPSLPQGDEADLALELRDHAEELHKVLIAR